MICWFMDLWHCECVSMLDMDKVSYETLRDIDAWAFVKAVSQIKIPLQITTPIRIFSF